MTYAREHDPEMEEDATGVLQTERWPEPHSSPRVLRHFDVLPDQVGYLG